MCVRGRGRSGLLCGDSGLIQGRVGIRRYESGIVLERTGVLKEVAANVSVGGSGDPPPSPIEGCQQRESIAGEL